MIFTCISCRSLLHSSHPMYTDLSLRYTSLSGQQCPEALMAGVRFTTKICISHGEK